MKNYFNLLVFFMVLFSATSHAQLDSNSADEQDVNPQSTEGSLVGQLEEERQALANADLYSNTANPDDYIGQMRRRALEVDGVNIPDVKASLFFTPRELDLITEARNGLVARLATDAEIAASQNEAARPRGPREVSLVGILYLSDNEWTVWINNQKITPDRIPPEITDIKVGKDYVRIKWYDAYTNQIFPIKIRPQQRFNIDSRIFLPG